MAAHGLKISYNSNKKETKSNKNKTIHEGVHNGTCHHYAKIIKNDFNLTLLKKRKSLEKVLCRH